MGRGAHLQKTNSPKRGDPESADVDSSSLECLMAVAKITEIQTSSPKSFEDAVQVGIARAEKTLKNLTGAWIKSQKVVIEKGKITEYRVLLKVTFVLKD